MREAQEAQDEQESSSGDLAQRGRSRCERKGRTTCDGGMGQAYEGMGLGSVLHLVDEQRLGHCAVAAAFKLACACVGSAKMGPVGGAVAGAMMVWAVGEGFD